MNATFPLLTALTLGFSTPAMACGGFFCNNALPVEQAGEQIVFAVDSAAGQVTAHVQIKYAGSPGEFAWIVPTPGQPELFTSTDALFTALQARTRPSFWLEQVVRGECSYPSRDTGWNEVDDTVSDTQDNYDTGYAEPELGVTVVSTATVGPYDTVVLQANSSAGLLTWLQAAGYDLPNALDGVLAPYVANGQYFVALKLTAGADTGDLTPLGMRYRGNGAGIPVQLTSIAATPDMRLEVFLLGDARAVPDNYLHVTVNDAAIDWFNAGSNYESVISMAANEAGGHAFATDYSGSTSGLQGVLWRGQDAAVDALRGLDDPIAWAVQVQQVGLPPSAALLDVLLEVLPVPAAVTNMGVPPTAFYDCLSCYAEHIDASGFSGAAATAVLEARLINGLRDAQALVSAYPHLTRLTSSLDAIEMTVDPSFVFNHDLPQSVSQSRGATVEILCETLPTGGATTRDEARRRLQLADGRAIRLPSSDALDTQRRSELEAIGDLVFPAAILIERLGASGQGEILFDYRDQAAREAEAFGDPADASGCGCGLGAPGSGVFAMLTVLGALIRRRR